MVKTSHSKVERGMRMGRLGLSLTGSYLAYQVQNLFMGKNEREERRTSFHSRASRKVRQELEVLKGPAMKMGQILSMMGTTLPPEAIDELTRLQGRAPGMHPTLARAQFKAALGKIPEEVFRDFEEEPFAAASLGQVHRAVTRGGETVAVKIQYPAIRTAIENDFKMFKTASFAGRLSGHIPRELVEEIETGFLRETDYVNEARNIEFFQKAYAPLGYMRLPRVHWQLSSDRVLTMSMVEGLHLDAWLAENPPPDARQLLGFRLAKVYNFQMRGPRAFHADPHPGNYLFGRDGSIGLVDFGCVKHCTPEFAEFVDALMGRIWLNGESGFRRVIELLFGNRLSPTSAKARKVARLAIQFYELIFPTDTPGRMEVDFGNAKLMSAMTSIWNGVLRSRAVNPEFAFASRAELGLYHVLHKLNAKVDTALVREQVSRMIVEAGSTAGRPSVHPAGRKTKG